MPPRLRLFPSAPARAAGRLIGLCAVLALAAAPLAAQTAAPTADAGRPAAAKPAESRPADAPSTPSATPPAATPPAAPSPPAAASSAPPSSGQAPATPPGSGSDPAKAATPVAPASPAPAPAPAPAAPAPASPGAPSPAAPGAVAPQAATPSAEGETPLVTLAPRPAAILRGTSNWGQGYPAILTAFARLAKALDANGLKPAGKPLAVLIETRDDGFTFEAMAPLDAAPAGKSELEPDIRIGATPAGKAYKFQHRSAYDDLDSTYEAITAFLDEKAMQAKDVIIEEYLTTPKDADDTTLEVDVYVFLKE